MLSCASHTSAPTVGRAYEQTCESGKGGPTFKRTESIACFVLMYIHIYIEYPSHYCVFVVVVSEQFFHFR